MLDRAKLVAAIAERLKLRLDEDDPAFVLVELNRLALEEACAGIVADLAPVADRIEASAKLAASELISAAVDQVSAKGKDEVAAIEEAGKVALQRLTDALELSVVERGKAQRLLWFAFGSIATFAVCAAAAWIAAPLT